MGRVVPLAGKTRRRAVVDDSSSHEHEPLDELLHRPELVGDEQNGCVELAVQLTQQRGERLLCVDVDTRGRLVEHEEVRFAGERLGDERALLLAAGEGRDGSRRLHRKADSLDRRPYERLVALTDTAERSATRNSARGHDLLHGHR